MVKNRGSKYSLRAYPRSLFVINRGGKLVIPVGKAYQSLILVEKQPDGTTTKRDVIAVRFVPMTGEAQK